MHDPTRVQWPPMGYQFIHIEGYARKGSQQRKDGRLQTRKWGIRDIAAEAERAPEACRHVAAPQPPVVLHGVMPDEAADLAEAWAEAARDAKGRKLRADGLCLLAGVASLPADQADEWPQYRAAALRWLQGQYGERLRSAVEHTDEEHPHLHFYVVPLPGERFEAVHVGRQAAAKVAAIGQKKGDQNAAYKAAMQAWQDHFQAHVASAFGLARTGPKRERLTRAQWKERRAKLKASAQARQAVGSVITPEVVKKRVTKQGGILGINKEYETAEELAARLDALARKAYRPALEAQKVVAAARHTADAMQKLADDRGELVAMLEKRLAETHAQLDAARKDNAAFHQVFMAGLDGPEQEQVMRMAGDLRRKKEREAQAKYEASLSPEYREHLVRAEAEFRRSLRAVEAEEAEEKRRAARDGPGPNPKL